MSLFDNNNLPILAAFAIAAPEIFGAEAVAGGTEAVAADAAAQAAAQEAARQEAARIAAEEAAKEAAKQVAAQGASQGILQAAPEFTGALPQGYAPGQVDAITQGAGQGIQVAGPAQVPPPAGLNQTGIVQAGDLTGVNPYPSLQPGQTYGEMGEVVGSYDPTADRTVMNSNMGYQGSELPIPSNSPVVPETSTPSALWDGFEKFADKHPYMTGAAMYGGAHALGWLDPNSVEPPEKYKGSLNNYRISPNFQGSTANPEDYRYTPRYATGGIMGAGPVEQMSNANAIGANTGYPMANVQGGAYATPFQTPVSQNVVSGAQDTAVDPYTGQQQFAEGGIAHFARGNLASSLDYYTNMMDGHNERRALPEKGDVGIYHDLDPDTRYQDALTAAQIRQAKVNKRANMQLPSMKRPTPMGTLNLRPPGVKGEAGGSTLDPENAAQGGIMQAHGHLGGYAAGGNPRLLKGPGDGMSDNIPATIAGKQPARLADGEFVVPADVVSHLGNGSTDAGAKKLHQMMTNVRKARTGNPKQGKQINPNKFTPK